MKLTEFLKTEQLEEMSGRAQPFNGSVDQAEWYRKLKETVIQGYRIFEDSSWEKRQGYQKLFEDWVRTEELKAWYGTPSESGSLFQGTSVSSLTIPAEFDEPLHITGIQQLEETIADAYISLHDRYAQTVESAIMEDVSEWIRQGLYYGVVLPSKLISQAFDLTIPSGDVIFDVDGHTVDPHEILSYPQRIREKYFERCKERIQCFAELDISQTEFEESLILSDISKPKISAYRGKLMLAPVKCNEICSLISCHLRRLIYEKTDGRISPSSLMVTIYDTDTPYTYHKTGGFAGNPMAPVLPGLVVLGCSGTADAFRWLYAYRVSLIAQKMMKGSLYSQTMKKYTPFIFFGVLVPRDAEILLDMDNLGSLRYRGNLSPSIEYSYLLPKIASYLDVPGLFNVGDELLRRAK